ncbi:MAG: efflux RND transporter permease subunit, partial [Spirochaetes bacterium]|nr:efflux RND transporter permease subunit [Spirochaetota bacterium]
GGVYVHVEFEPGTAMEIVDERLAGYALSLAEVPGVGSVQSTARRGSGSVLLSLDKSSADRSLAAKAARAARETPVQGGFAWVPRPSRDERAWSLVVAGDDDRECRDIAAEAARAVAALPFVAQTVLDFKDGPGDVTIRPDRERSAAMGIPFSSAAAALRRAVFGPVAYKRVDGAGETDVRVAASRDGKPRPRDIGATLAQTGNGAARVDSFSRIGLEKDVSRIRRLDRRRVASISARCAPLDPREARASFYAAVSGVALPPGYSIEFDRDAIEAADRLGGAGASFALAASLAFMIAAALSESFGAPLAVIAALPPSLAVPALLLAVSGSPMDAATASAFVAVSGMSVNASFLTFDERRRVAARPGAASAYDAYRMTRARIGSLAATSATSVAGSLPFLFLSDPGSGLVRSLAFVAATGTAVSFLSALTVIPALASAAPRLFNGPATSASLMKEGSIQ